MGRKAAWLNGSGWGLPVLAASVEAEGLSQSKLLVLLLSVLLRRETAYPNGSG